MTNQTEPALAVYRQLLEAWNRRDADGFATVFTEDGNCVEFDGSMMNGRAEIASTLRSIFDHHPTARHVARVREIRTLTPTVVLVRSVVGMIPPDKDELNPAASMLWPQR